MNLRLGESTSPKWPAGAGGSQWWQEMQNIINNSPIVPIIEQQLLVDFEAFKQREITNLEELKQQIEDALSGFGEAAGNFANTRK